MGMTSTRMESQVEEIEKNYRNSVERVAVIADKFTKSEANTTT